MKHRWSLRLKVVSCGCFSQSFASHACNWLGASSIITYASRIEIRDRTWKPLRISQKEMLVSFLHDISSNDWRYIKCFNRQSDKWYNLARVPFAGRPRMNLHFDLPTFFHCLASHGQMNSVCTLPFPSSVM